VRRRSSTTSAGSASTGTTARFGRASARRGIGGAGRRPDQVFTGSAVASDGSPTHLASARRRRLRRTHT
jgi:hypothetical protein